MLKANLPATTTQDDAIFLRGGLDLLTPSLNLKPGVCRRALNFEADANGGYTRIKGYERHDGRASPSAATYDAIDLTITGSIVAGDIITGGTSGATGTVIHVDTPLVVYTAASGTFVNGEDIEVSAVVEATVMQVPGDVSAQDASFQVRMYGLAADVYRALIQAIPGSGPVRGVLYLNGELFGFRDNAGATALDVYKTTGSGWAAVSLARTVSFTAGSNEYVEGDTLSQGGVSATVLRVALESGTWAGTAAGRFIIGTVTGGAFAAGASAGGGVATLSGADTAQTLLPGGSWEFDIGSVGARRRAYGADGVNKGIEFDGTVMVPINTGNATDTPSRVMVHEHHLFFAFGNSVQHSGISTPYDWTALAGAGEMLADGDVTQMRRAKGDQTTGVAAICNDSGTQLLYGTSEADFQLKTFEDSAGAKPRSAQLMGQIYTLDDRGVMALSASQDFGNFAAAALTLPIRPFVYARRNSVTGSLVNREKSQYRVFFSDGSGLYITIANGNLVGSMPIQFPNIPLCCCAGDSSDGAEVGYFGDEDGFVYQLDTGTSFDGAAIDYEFTLNFAHQGAPRKTKRYRRASVEISGSSYCAVELGARFGYAVMEREQWLTTPSTPVPLEQVNWDSMVWDAFVWDGETLAPAYMDLSGSGDSVALTVRGSSAVYGAFTINSILLAYSMRREMR